MLVLTVLQGPDKGRRYELPNNEPQLVGRSSEALPLSDTTVSRRHAELTPDDGKWYIRDLGSQNGTWINGVRISERMPLRPGDQIRTGSTLFVFGRTDADEGAGVIRIARADVMDSTIEKAVPSSEDSVILSEPEPRSAAVHHLQVIYRITQLAGQARDQKELLEGVMDLVFNEFRPERGFVVLAESLAGGRRPRPTVVKYAQQPLSRDDAKIHISRTILEHTLRKGEGVLASNAMNDPRFAAGDSVQRMAIRSAICSPIRYRERTYGVIYIDSSLANFTYTGEQLTLLNAVGQHAGLALASLELAAQKLQSERLAAIGQTVASLSHSIKNILQGLRGGADVVEMGLKKEDFKVARGGWAILKRNLDRIMALTLNMLAYSRPRTLEVQLTKLGPLLEDCAGLLHDRAVAKEVALIVDVDADVPPVAVDPQQVHQAVMNLLGNAVDAVETKTGIVTVRGTYVPKGPDGRPWARIAVIDNGSGIAPDRHEKIFEPFFTTKGMRGTGLGLAVARKIAADHGGRIELVSTEGSGATFTLVLPADARLGAIDPSATAQTRTVDPLGGR